MDRVIHISENGAFKGSAEIDIAEIHGEFNGTLTVRQKLVIYSTGKGQRQDPLRQAGGGRGRAAGGRDRSRHWARAHRLRPLWCAQSPPSGGLRVRNRLGLSALGRRLRLGQRARAPIGVYGHIGQRGLGHLHIAALVEKRSAYTSTCTVTEVLPTRVMCEKNDRMSPTRTGFEMNFIDRHRGHAALHIARGQHRSGQVHLGHHPAAKNIAVGVAVARHGNDFEHQFVARWAMRRGRAERGRHGHNH